MDDVEGGLERLHEASLIYAKRKAEYARAEETLKIVFSNAVVAAGGAIAKAEHVARASFDYREAADRLADARADMEEAKAELDYLEKRWETWRTRSANQRAQLKE